MSFCNSEKAIIIEKELIKLEFIPKDKDKLFELRCAISKGLDKVDETQNEYDHI